MSNSKLLFCGFLFAVLFLPHLVAQDSWTPIANIPTARYGHSAVNVNTRESKKIYAIGGYNETAETVSPVEEYDLMTNKWTKTTDLPTLRGYCSSCEIGGKIYVFGGYNPATVVTVEKYDPETNIWETKSPMPTARWGHSAVVVYQKVYIIGGARYWPAEFIEMTDVYDPMTNKWTSKTPIPTPRWLSSCCYINGKIYVIGGHDEVTTVGTVEAYDPSTDTWETKSPMPTARWGLKTAVVDGKIYAIGGGDKYPATTCYTVVEEYDPEKDTWTTKSPMPVGRIGTATAAINGKIYVIGGGGVREEEAHPESYVYDPVNETSTKVTNLPALTCYLYQNNPNPFYQSTYIPFDVQDVGQITLNVYDVLGRQVSTLINREMNEGHHEVLFNRKDLPSGVYYYRIDMGDFSQTKKMLLNSAY